jgi:hypothetical protein
MIRKLFQLGEWADAAEKFLDCLALIGKTESCSVFRIRIRIQEGKNDPQK